VLAEVKERSSASKQETGGGQILSEVMQAAGETLISEIHRFIATCRMVCVANNYGF
jgi:hypothetical protein